ncbi:MAG: hypothetical protein FWE16_03970 [Firmicutes bacterium]|nr:hypothetical protein [Bacillota bacterium]
MNDCENILVQISEIAFTEIDNVKSIKHNENKDNEQSASFDMVVNDEHTEKEFVVSITQKK